MTKSASTEEGITYIEVPVAIAGCVIYIFVAIAIHYYKETYHHMPWIHESSVACLIGVLMGGVILWTTHETVVFDYNLFFYLVLPPVIFSAGYSLKRKNFFKYMDLIAFFGIIGTILNFTLIACGAYAYGRLFGDHNWYRVSWNEALIFSAVLTGSDEVSARSMVQIKDFPRMGALIFGEGVVNDAMSIVLFKTFLPLYNSEHEGISLQQELKVPAPSSMGIVQSICIQIVCSLLIGVICGLVHARLMRVLPMIKHFPIYQTALVMLFGYLSYCIAEATGISGILTVFIAAVTLAHYSWYNLSSSAQITTRLSFAAIAEIAEGFAFSYVGLSLWVYEVGDTNIAFGVYMLVVVIAARLTTILGLFKVCSLCFKSFRVPLSEQLGFTLGGVVRGCLCWAQILQVQHSPVLIKATLLIVMTTSLGSGVLLPMLLPMLTPIPLKGEPTVETYIEQDSEPNSPVLGNNVPFPDTGNTLMSSTATQGKYARLRTPDRATAQRSRSSDIEENKTTDHVNNINLNTTPPPKHNHNHDSKLTGSRYGHGGLSLAISPAEREREYHFEYEPFSADLPTTTTKDGGGRIAPFTAQRGHSHTSNVSNTSAYTRHSHTIPTATANHRNSNNPLLYLSPDPLDDLRSNEELIELISAQAARTQTQSFTSKLFWRWVRFDEIFMKPLFGGSDRRHRLLQERGRQLRALSESQRGMVGVSSGASSNSVGVNIEANDNSSAGVNTHLQPPSLNKSYGSVNPTNYNTSTTTDANIGNSATITATAAASTHHIDTSTAAASTNHAFTTSIDTRSLIFPHMPITDSFWSPGGREYVLEENREDELELDKLAEEICLLNREEEDRED